MSAVGNVQASAGHAEADDEEAPGLWSSFGTALRLIVGWFCVAIGILNLIVELDRTDGTPDGAYLIFHGMLFVGGVLMVSLAWIDPRPGFAGYFAGAVVLAAGMLFSGLPVSDSVCCMTGFDIRHGWPFTFVARDEAARWHVDSQHLLADLLFWGYVGLIVLLVIALARRVTTHHDEAGE